MNGSGLAILAITIPIMIAIGGGIFKVASLRGSVHREWALKIDQLLSGVDEYAIRQLRKVYENIGSWLTSGRGFWPDGPPPSPDALDSLVGNYSRAVRYRNRLERDIRYLMWVGPIGIAALTIGLVPLLLASLKGAGRLESGIYSTVLSVTSGVAIVGVVVALGSYVALHHRLTSVEVLVVTGD